MPTYTAVVVFHIETETEAGAEAESVWINDKLQSHWVIYDEFAPVPLVEGEVESIIVNGKEFIPTLLGRFKEKQA